MNTEDADDTTRPDVKLDKHGEIYKLETPGGQKVILNDEEKSATFQDIHGNRIIMNEDGISIESIKDIRIKAAGEIKI